MLRQTFLPRKWTTWQANRSHLLTANLREGESGLYMKISNLSQACRIILLSLGVSGHIYPWWVYLDSKFPCCLFYPLAGTGRSRGKDAKHGIIIQREEDAERERESPPSSRKQRERIRPLISWCIIHSLHWCRFMISGSTEGWSHYTPMNRQTNTQPHQPHYTITARQTPIPRHSMPINAAGQARASINNHSSQQLQHAYEVR